MVMVNGQIDLYCTLQIIDWHADGVPFLILPSELFCLHGSQTTTENVQSQVVFDSMHYCLLPQ